MREHLFGALLATGLNVISLSAKSRFPHVMVNLLFSSVNPGVLSNCGL